MLEELSIEGLGVIDSAAVSLNPGLTVLTGETGAGKTMVVTSLHLLAGGRPDASRVRSGAKKAVVEGRFLPASSQDQRSREVVESAGGEVDEDGSVITSRSVGEDGRSRAYLGGRSVPVGVLANYTSSLLAIHGQNEQIKLMTGRRQRELLDEFGGKQIAKALSAYRKARQTYLEREEELRERTEQARELARETDQLTAAINEIDRVQPRPGEDAELVDNIKRLTALDTLRDNATDAHAVLTGDVDDQGGVLDRLGEITNALRSCDDSALTALVGRVSEASILLADVSDELSSYLSTLPSDSTALETLLHRQSELKTLLRKYASSADGVLEWADQARQRVASIDVSADAIQKLSNEVVVARDEVLARANELTLMRRIASEALSSAVSGELAGLAMGGATFSASVSPSTSATDQSKVIERNGESIVLGESGADVVDFGLIAYKGAPVLSIGKSASGGELSRVMLALEVVLASSSSGMTMVFDEVDAGVGGGAAVEIGRRLARLATSHQVLVVTHLPQVAAFADTHIVVGKTASTSKVTSTVTTLGDAERVAELARMLAGLGDTDTGRAHAQELLETAMQDKARFAST